MFRVQSNNQLVQVYELFVVETLANKKDKETESGCEVVLPFGVPSSQIFEFEAVDSNPTLTRNAKIGLIYMIMCVHSSIFCKARQL